MAPPPTIDFRPADSRLHTELGWLDSWHCFSFGHHYDPDNVGHGLLIVSNDDTVSPGGGFGTHGHRDMEIVSWVLEGALEHRDSAGHEGVIRPGTIQRMSAGTGVMHSEMNHSTTEPVHFLQMWVVPDEMGIAPSYEERDVSDLLADGGLVEVASASPDGGVSIRQAGASLRIGRLRPSQSVEVPDAPFVHLFVARGRVRLGDDELSQGDAARLTGAGTIPLTAADPSEVVVWSSDRAVAR